jgi:hypothetical protein
MAGRASFLPFLLILLLVAQVGCVKGGAQPLQIWHCYNNDSAVGPGSVRPIWIDPTDWKVGHIQTPNFPSPFPLPLECLWIFNNTRLLRNSRNQLQKYLHFYFTQVKNKPNYSFFLPSYFEARAQCIFWPIFVQ